MYFAHDTPREHPTISKEELEYIETTVGEEQDHLTPKGQVCTGSEICGGLIVLGGGGGLHKVVPPCWLWSTTRVAAYSHESAPSSFLVTIYRYVE